MYMSKRDKQIEQASRMKSGYNGLLWETGLTGKLEYFFSITTPPTCNSRCQVYRIDPNKICANCYSCAAMNYRKAFREKLVQNYLQLKEVLPMEALPVINLPYERIESHGDVDNVNQVINYFNICNKNPDTQFTVWSKNPDLYDKAIKAGHAKPKNLIFVLSSFFKNVVADPGKWPFVDIVFTVFTAEYAIEHDIIINCGGQKCINCLTCYTPAPGIRYINEMLKSDQKRYYKMLAEKLKREAENK